MADEWRVEVELGEEGHEPMGERLRALDIDDEARARLGDGVIVTRDGPHLFLYATSEHVVREAESVVRALLAAEGLDANVAVTRWHPDEEAWKDAATPMPTTEEERAAERARHEAAEEREGTYEWEVRVDLPSLHDAHELERSLLEEGMHVKRRWRHVLVGAPSEERALELADRLRAEGPEGAEVRVAPTVVANPLSVWLGLKKPGVARDLGL